MARQIYKNLAAVDQLSVFEPDGVTKHSGLVSGDFAVLVYQDGAIRTPFTTLVTEILGGEYKIDWTPDAAGFWLIEVSNSYNDEIWFGEYDVVEPVLLGIT